MTQGEILGRAHSIVMKAGGMCENESVDAILSLVNDAVAAEREACKENAGHAYELRKDVLRLMQENAILRTHIEQLKEALHADPCA